MDIDDLRRSFSETELQVVMGKLLEGEKEPTKKLSVEARMQYKKDCITRWEISEDLFRFWEGSFCRFWDTSRKELGEVNKESFFVILRTIRAFVAVHRKIGGAIEGAPLAIRITEESVWAACQQLWGKGGIPQA